MLNLLNHKLIHNTFGEGIVTSQTSTTITVKFDNSEKKLGIDFIIGKGAAHFVDDELQEAVKKQIEKNKKDLAGMKTSFDIEREEYEKSKERLKKEEEEKRIKRIKEQFELITSGQHEGTIYSRKVHALEDLFFNYNITHEDYVENVDWLTMSYHEAAHAVIGILTHKGSVQDMFIDKETFGGTTELLVGWNWLEIEFMICCVAGSIGAEFVGCKPDVACNHDYDDLRKNMLKFYDNSSILGKKNIVEYSERHLNQVKKDIAFIKLAARCIIMENIELLTKLGDELYEMCKRTNEKKITIKADRIEEIADSCSLNYYTLKKIRIWGMNYVKDPDSFDCDRDKYVKEMQNKVNRIERKLKETNQAA